MKRPIILLAGLFAAALAQGGESPSQLFFEVHRDGESVGSHCLKFTRQGDQLEVEVGMELQVQLPLWFDYRYRYRALERWQDGRLAALDVRIEDGSKQRRIEARRRAGALEVEAPGGTWRLPGNLLTSNHWNPAALEQGELLNTLTGRASRIDSQYLGADRLPFGEAELDVRRYRLGGDLEDTVVWYDGSGGWRGLEFSARDGSRVRLKPRQGDSLAFSQSPWNRNPLCRPGQRSG
ncbi:hypothetical protein GCM10011348_14880 [Marinobacterium nitratireducens]|uniref:DUF3108 domain-containing protein n=1 Tax=Marinobacterium nitratireducens TaxID=518897 RepID=A0A917ZD57_9GAMM|nr:DUF6134 family protein [Marinobacterium nitratireducens]GGO79759.1 hypothetical protein GCM10011348_14880 [Marinobacterium nitratireducens]